MLTARYWSNPKDHCKMQIANFKMPPQLSNLHFAFLQFSCSQAQPGNESQSINTNSLDTISAWA
jgi:hypothetical protein